MDYKAKPKTYSDNVDIVVRNINGAPTVTIQGNSDGRYSQDTAREMLTRMLQLVAERSIPIKLYNPENIPLDVGTPVILSGRFDGKPYLAMMKPSRAPSKVEIIRD